MDKDLDEKEETADLHISNKFQLKPDREVHYGNVIISGDGYFHMEGGNRLEIDSLVVKKEAYHRKYGILIQGPDGEDGREGKKGKNAPDINATEIVIHQLVDSVHVKSLGGNGGTGGKGAKGRAGGKGGNAVCKETLGGAGGQGSQGGRGKCGGNGSKGPVVTIRYMPANEEAEIRILSRDDADSDEKKSYGGRGGAGGEGGEGGDGGKGGLNGGGLGRAKDGQKGDAGPFGRRGRDGKDTNIRIEILQ